MKQNSNDSCGGENWFQFKNKCYLFHHDLSGASFHEAINICERYHHAHLLQIESLDENKFLQTYLFEKLQLKFSIWLGLIRINVTNFLWLYNRHPLYRLNDNQSTVKTIVDDNDNNDNHHDQWSSYTNWAPNEPNNLDSKHYCVVMSSEKSKLLFGHWYDVECSKVFLVVCERNNHNQDFSNENDTIFNFLTNQNDDDHHHHQIDTSINSNDIHRLIHLLSINLFIWIILFIIIAIWFFYQKCYRHRYYHNNNHRRRQRHIHHRQRQQQSSQKNILDDVDNKDDDDDDDDDDEMRSSSFVWNSKYSRQNSSQSASSSPFRPSIFDRFFQFGNNNNNHHHSDNNHRSKESRLTFINNNPNPSSALNESTTDGNTRSLNIFESPTFDSNVINNNNSNQQQQQQIQHPCHSIVRIPQQQQYPDQSTITHNYLNHAFMIETTDI
ncbi:hypothetical protein DERP_003159 [Dermatophagoides pteronyssinus]|uniref:C-type lectin domain-containing protein n=1 Tax=Dermatophagoides pteronyssinus TaxID=6956 RepID=A0ABQ8JIS9_DERPT|nr:hypothetical protein DERP_003159 [Dermatophagoides pteronyssinus]